MHVAAMTEAPLRCDWLLRAVEAGSNAEERQPDPRGHTDALKFMRYSVKTVYGVSVDTYQGTMFEPLFGTGQGSGASSDS